MPSACPRGSSRSAWMIATRRFAFTSPSPEHIKKGTGAGLLGFTSGIPVSSAVTGRGARGLDGGRYANSTHKFPFDSTPLYRGGRLLLGDQSRAPGSQPLYG